MYNKHSKLHSSLIRKHRSSLRTPLAALDPSWFQIVESGNFPFAAVTNICPGSSSLRDTYHNGQDKFHHHTSCQWARVSALEQIIDVCILTALPPQRDLGFFPSLWAHGFPRNSPPTHYHKIVFRLRCFRICFETTVALPPMSGSLH